MSVTSFHLDSGQTRVYYHPSSCPCPSYSFIRIESSDDVTAAMLEEWNILLGIEHYFYANSSFCFILQMWLLVTWANTLYNEIAFVAFSVPSPSLDQILYKGFDWTVFINKCGYGILPIAIYSICQLVLFLPCTHSSGKAAFLGCAYNL